MKTLMLILLFSAIISCGSQSSSHLEEKEIVFENIKGDSIVVFYGSNKDTLNVFRKIEVLENNNTDTITLGYTIIPPGFIGDLFFIQNGLDKSSAIYIDRTISLDPHNKASYAKLFTIGLWKKEMGAMLRQLKIKIWLKAM